MITPNSIHLAAVACRPPFSPNVSVIVASRRPTSDGLLNGGESFVLLTKCCACTICGIHGISVSTGTAPSTAVRRR